MTIEWNDSSLDDNLEPPQWKLLGGAIREGETEHQIIADHESPLESNLQNGGCALLLTSFAPIYIIVTEGWYWGWLLVGFLFALSILLFKLRGQLDDTYVLDTQTKEIWFHRAFFSLSKRNRVCDFRDIEALMLVPFHRVQPRHPRNNRWEYGLGLLRKNGQMLPLSTTYTKAYSMVCNDGKVLAERLRFPFIRAGEELYLKVKMGASGPEVDFTPEEH